jgi:hypothetical protein
VVRGGEGARVRTGGGDGWDNLGGKVMEAREPTLELLADLASGFRGMGGVCFGGGTTKGLSGSDAVDAVYAVDAVDGVDDVDDVDDVDAFDDVGVVGLGAGLEGT